MHHFYKTARHVCVCVCVCVCACVLAIQLCPTLCDSMDCSPPGSSVHGILQARILEWVAIPFSWGSSSLRDWTWVSHIAARFFTIWVTRGAPKTTYKGPVTGRGGWINKHRLIWITTQKAAPFLGLAVAPLSWAVQPRGRTSLRSRTPWPKSCLWLLQKPSGEQVKSGGKGSRPSSHMTGEWSRRIRNG